jgi:hypothetical protein
VRRLRHLASISTDLFRYGWIHRLWWALPIVVLLALVVLVASAGQATAPYLVYPMF